MTAPLGPDSDWTRQSASAIAGAVRQGRCRSADVLDAHLQQIDRIETASEDGPALGAFIETWAETARRRADVLDARRRAGQRLGALAGVPVAVKDNYAVAGQVASCGSRTLAEWTAPYTACAIERLLAADAILIGRTNMDEFGMGSSTERSIHGVTRNPVDRSRTAGGSSGGSAAAVAAHCAPLALGSDTGGSVRQPAALCGIIGFKPTYGRIPRHGLTAFASSLDVVAPFARQVRDLVLAHDVMAGPDPRDSSSLQHSPDSGLWEFNHLHSGRLLDDLRIGVPEAAFGQGLDPEVETAVRTAIDTLARRGARVVPVELPHLEHAVAVYYLICTAEASSNLARYDGVHYGHRSAASDADDLNTTIARSRSEGFGDEVKLRILLGTYGLSSGHVDAYYDKASRVRSLIRLGFEQAFEHCDVLAMPTSPFVAWPLGAMLDDPLAMYLADVLTVAPSLAGVPALSIPCGNNAAGLPIGLQLVAPALADAKLLGYGAAFERSMADSR